jgi:hypothetical protein
MISNVVYSVFSSAARPYHLDGSVVLAPAFQRFFYFRDRFAVQLNLAVGLLRFFSKTFALACRAAPSVNKGLAATLTTVTEAITVLFSGNRRVSLRATTRAVSSFSKKVGFKLQALCAAVTTASRIITSGTSNLLFQVMTAVAYETPAVIRYIRTSMAAATIATTALNRTSAFIQQAMAAIVLFDGAIVRQAWLTFNGAWASLTAVLNTPRRGALQGALNVLAYAGRRLGTVIEPTVVNFFQRTLTAQVTAETSLFRQAWMTFYGAFTQAAIALNRQASNVLAGFYRLPVVLFSRLRGVPAAAVGDFDGPNYGTVAVNDSSVGDVAWVNTGNVTSSDDSYATVTLVGETSTWLVVTGFNFSVYPGREITGVKLEAEMKGDPSQPYIISSRLVKYGSIGSTNKIIAFDGTETFRTAGVGNTEMWGTTITPADINRSDFGVAIRRASATFATFSIDSVRITVYHRNRVPGFRWLTNILGRFGR